MTRRDQQPSRTELQRGDVKNFGKGLKICDTCDRSQFRLTSGQVYVCSVTFPGSTAVVPGYTHRYTFLKEIQNGFDLWYLSIYLLRILYQRVGITHESTRSKMGPRKVCCCTPSVHLYPSRVCKLHPNSTNTSIPFLT